MKILVIGATGKVGQEVLRCLVSTEHTVLGSIRKLEQADSIEQFAAEPVLIDLKMPIKNIHRDIDVIIFVAGSSGQDVEAVDYQGLVKVVDMAAKNNAKRFLYISSLNVGKTQTQFIGEMQAYYAERNQSTPDRLLKNAQSEAYKKYVELKALAEQKLIESGLNYTILRAGLLTQELASKRVKVQPGQSNAFGTVSRENIAWCFVETLENQNTYKKTFTVFDGERLIDKELFN
ncbi:MAG: SDR family oxidoreductase [Gammaproteobacteria bacterium]|nr:SDR family oxidoreductase [Gammaproteobacteria bacterium]